jgi:DNA-binding NtrC family response regulator
MSGPPGALRALERLTGGSRAIARLREQIQAIATSRAPVLIQGESGSGKALLADTIHRTGPTRKGPFAGIQSAARAEDDLEAALFGVEGRRARTSPGALEAAGGGTVFLDDVDALAPSLQLLLLRTLLERSFERQGGSTPIALEARIIAATRLDLEDEVRAGRFRADLLARLAVVKVHVPPLRERREDIPLLVERFLTEPGSRRGSRVTGVTRGVIERFEGHDWPGNVRELRETLERMVAQTARGGPLQVSDLPDALPEGGPAAERLELAVGMTVEEAERRLVVATLRHTGGDKPRAAAMLGIGLRTLYRKLDTYERARAARPRRTPEGARPRRAAKPTERPRR